MSASLLPRATRSSSVATTRIHTHLALSNRSGGISARKWQLYGPNRVSGAATRGRTELRSLSSSASRPFALAKSHPPKSKDRGPKSEEDTQTDFSAMNVLGNTPPPTTAVDACMDDGFALDSGLRVIGSGVLLVGGECFRWRPWVREGRKEGTIEAGASGDDIKGAPSMSGHLRNKTGQLDISKDAWGILDLVWPKPDLLILGTGEKMIPLAPETRKNINELGIRIEVQDTRNAAAQFNMLATERGTQQIAAALVPVGWKEGK